MPDIFDEEAAAIGDERYVTKTERWMEGRTVVECSEFFDGEGQRWRQLVFDSGKIVQILLTHPWLIVERQ